MKDLTQIFDNAVWPVFIIDETAAIRWANKAAANVFRIEVSKGDNSFNELWAEDNEMPVELFIPFIRRGGKLDSPIKLLDKNSKPVERKLLISPVKSDDEFLVLLQIPDIGADSSKKKTKAEPINSIPAKIEPGISQKQTLDSARQLIRTVVLDFNNALTTILGHTTLILSQLEPKHKWKRALMEVEKSAERVAEIANELATFSHQEKESRVLPAGNINTLIQRAAELFQSTKGPVIEWNMQLEPRPLAVKFDEAKLQQAFIKILENSVQSIPEKGRISISTRNLLLKSAKQEGSIYLEPGAYVFVEISDTGSGIPAEALPRIFEPFFTTKPNHRGLGLAWVYGVVSNHGGWINISSKPGAGTTVNIYFPATDHYIKDELISEPSALRGDQTILIVDDEELIRTMTHTILTEYGYNVVSAENGVEALDVFSRLGGKVDLVITDLVMPQMSGRELNE
ncbi:MAG: response regulator, partial [Verrucomicrobia bacterium]|nr:response regulator [Verrucomicrobiota bacterium]